MSSEDLFERNVADLVRHGALRPDAGGARGRFVAAAGGRPERLAWTFAAGAAAALIAATLVWLTRPDGPESTPGRLVVEPVVYFPTSDGNDLLKGVLTRAEKGTWLRFEGRSPLPDGLVFQVRVCRLEEKLAAGRLEQVVVDNPSGAAVLEHGMFSYDFPHKRPGFLRLEVSAKDALQDRAVVKVLKTPESEREWTFRHKAWTERTVALFGPQLAESTSLIAETRDLLGRVEAACASEAEFLKQKAALIKEAWRHAARGESFAQEGLYPASARAAVYVARDLATSMEIFTWEGGKFDGPKSYYTDGKRGRDHRQAVFEFSALRGYLDEAVKVAGREFCLWALEEYGRNAVVRPDLAAVVRSSREHPGVAEFVERLMTLPAIDRSKFAEELRTLGK